MIYGDPITFGGGGGTYQDKTVSPTETEQTVSPDSGYDALNSVTVEAISSSYVGSGIARKSSTDLETSGATVTAPAGYYENNATATIASGSATTPATTVTANPTISVNSSTGLITATSSATKSVTPTVVAGYVSSGTAGTITVSGSSTSQLTTKAAATITPGTSNKTIASGTYLIGTQTISGDADLVAKNILSGVNIFGVAGSLTGFTSSDAIIHVYTTAGATVTIKKGTTTVKTLSSSDGHTRSDDSTRADYYYVGTSSNFASYTVEAKLSSALLGWASFTVNAAKQYTANILGGYLIADGITQSGYTCAKCSGGATNYSDATVTQYTDNIALVAHNRSGRGIYVGPFNPSTKGWTTLTYDVAFNIVSANNQTWVRAGVATDAVWYDKNISTNIVAGNSLYSTNFPRARFTASVDISGVGNRSVYLRFNAWFGQDSTDGFLRLYNIKAT